MNEFPHIDSVYKRDGRGKFMLGEFSAPEFEYLKDLPWSWTEKIDGTNIRIMFNGGKAAREQGDGFVRFGGKTDNAQIPTKLLEYLQNNFSSSQFTTIFGATDVCLYGEGYGAGIQKVGKNYSPEQKFILFDVRIGHWWLTREAVVDIADKLGIDVVPTFMFSLVSLNHPLMSILGTAQVEGWVGTPVVPLLKRGGERIITKIKYRDFIV
jgi:hypothetical protein